MENKPSAQDSEDKHTLALSRLAMLGEMLGGVSHELSNPVTVMQAYLGDLSDLIDVLKVKAGVEASEGEQAAKLISQLQTQLDRILKLIRSIKNASRASEDDPFESQDLFTLLEDGLQVTRNRQKGLGVRIDLQNEAKQVRIYCRASQIIQVVVNLLHNAYDAIAQLPDKWIKIKIHAHDNRVCVHFTDSGEGIDQEISGRIFDAFFTTKPVGLGTGLGLSISKKIVKAHQGELLLQKEDGHTSFIIEFPNEKTFVFTRT